MGKTLLNQINALVSGRKSEVEKFVGDLHKLSSKKELFNGFHRKYAPLDEENIGERLPEEQQKVQKTVEGVFGEAREKWADLWDLVATQDEGNTRARSDVVVDGVPVLTGVPVTTLLFLEKQLADLQSYCEGVPTPDPTEQWEKDNTSTGLLKSSPSTTVRTKKVTSHKIVVPATKEHPAQVAVTQDDQVTGHWTKFLFSGALPASEKEARVQRVKKLRDAVKMAREQANLQEVKKADVASHIFSFVLGK